MATAITPELYYATRVMQDAKFPRPARRDIIRQLGTDRFSTVLSHIAGTHSTIMYALDCVSTQGLTGKSAAEYVQGEIAEQQRRAEEARVMLGLPFSFD